MMIKEYTYQVKRIGGQFQTAKIWFLLFLILFFCYSCQQKADCKQFDFTKLTGSGVQVWNGFNGKPDSNGVFEIVDIKFPKFEKAVYYRCDWWPTGANRVYGEIVSPDSLTVVKEGGMFLLLKLSDNKYLSILPLASENAYSWFDSDNSRFLLKMGTHGKVTIDGDIPLFSWAFSDNPYQACQVVWKKALECEFLDGVTKLRHQKKYPEPFNYLGWCSWEQFHKNVTQENMTKVIGQIEESEVPVRYFLLDDGFFDQQSIRTNEDFPDGLSALTRLKKENKVKWMGIWYAYLGDNHGIKLPGDIGDLKGSMIQSAANILLPWPEDEAAATKFYNYVLGSAKNDGFDFLKIDFQCDALTYYSGATHPAAIGGLPKNNLNAVDNPVKASVVLAKALHRFVDNSGMGLMNCNWHHSVSSLFSGNCVVGRCSEDYKVGSAQKAKAHLYHSYASIPWLGQIAWGDHDMFHSNDPFAGRMMAVSKAVSGGPVYLSDEPSDFLSENIAPLCYEDGRLLRPLAPAAPLPDDLFKSLSDNKLYKVVAPLNNQSAAIVAYNFGDKGEKFNDKITLNDYANASAMIQPYSGKWAIPEEGLFVYDWYSGSGKLMQANVDVSCEGFSDKLFIVVPVNKGWAVVGRTDKYLSPCAVENIQYGKDELSLTMKENGPFAFYLEKGIPFAENISFKKKAKGLWLAEIKKGERNVLIRIKRKN